MRNYLKIPMSTPATQSASKPRAGTKYFITFAGLIPAAVGVLVLTGWHAHIPALIQLRPDLPPMQYNTALCILLTGGGLCAWSRRLPRATQALGAPVAILAGMTLYEYLCGFDLRIDQLFFHPYITIHTSQPGRMAPASALCLLLTALALLFLGLRAERKWRAVAIGSLGSIVVTISMLAVLGYVIDLEGTYGWGQFTRIAFHTACALIVLGSGVFAAAWNEGRAKNELAPRWLPVTAMLAVIAASLVFYKALESRQNQEVEQAVMASGDGVKNTVSVRMDARIRSLVRMARRWEFSGRPARAVWENDAKNYCADFPDFQAIEWIDPSRLVRWIVPLEGNEAKLNQNLTIEERRHAAVEAALKTREPEVTRIVQLFRGGLGFIVYVPIYSGDNFDGWIVGVFKAQSLFDRFLPGALAPGYTVSLADGASAFYERDPGPRPSNAKWVYTSNVELRGATWTVRVWPAPALAAKMNSSLPVMVLIGGLVLSVLLAATVYLAQNSSSHARRTAALNVELQAAIDEVKTLSGLLPICAGCKRIRDDGGYWNQIERYISNHTKASFSHGICPECAIKFYESEGMEVPDEVLKAAEKRNYD